MEKVKRALKKKVPTPYHYLIKIQYNKHNMVVFNKKLKEHNEI